MSHVTRWVRHPHPKSQLLEYEQRNSITKIYIRITNWGSFVLLQIRANVVTNWSSFIITNWDKCCYKLGQPLLQLGAKLITNWGRSYKLGQLLQIEAYHYSYKWNLFRI